MPIPAGRYRLGPGDGTLALRTGRTGAAAKAGHDLLLHAAAWEAVLVIGEGPDGSSLALDVDGGSLRVQEGTGGMKALTEEDKAEIARTIDGEVLKRRPIAFRSREVRAGPGGLRAEGDLTLLGTARPIAVDVAVTDDGALAAAVVIAQSDWGIKPYSTLFGALKVADEVRIEIEARLPQSE